MVRGAAAALVLLLAATRANADEAPRLEYTVGPGVTGCPTEREFRDAVAERLGSDPFALESKRRFVVEVKLENGELGVTGALVGSDGSSAGTRRFAGAPGDCREVVQGMALALSLALTSAPGAWGASSATPDDLLEPTAEPERAVEPEATKPEPRVEPKPPPPTTAPRPAAEPAPAPETSTSAPLELGVGLAGHVAAGVAPDGTLGLSLIAFGRLAPWSLSLEGRFDGSSTLELEGDGVVTTTLFSAVLAPCRHFGKVMLCAVGLAGSVRAESDGIASPDSDAALYAAAGGRLGLELPVTGVLVVQTRVEGLLALLPADIVVGDEVVWSSPLVSGGFAAGLFGVFP